MKIISIKDYVLPDNFKFGVEIEGGFTRPQIKELKNSLTSKQVKHTILKDYKTYYKNDETNIALLNDDEFCKQNMIKIFEKNNIKLVNSHITWNNAQKNNIWVYGHDGSVEYSQALEIKSPPLVGEKGLNALKRILEILHEMNFNCNSSCGLHVHVSASKINVKHLRSIIAFYTLFENFINLLVSKSRHNNSYAMSMLYNQYDLQAHAKSLKTVIQDLNSYNNINSLIRKYSSKYYRLNVSAYNEHKTIEFRQHQGTINVESISKWIRFISKMIDECKTTNYADLKFLEKHHKLLLIRKVRPKIEYVEEAVKLKLV